MENSERGTSNMKNTFKNISQFALGIVAVALLTTVRLTPATATYAHPMLSLKTITVTGVLVAGGGGGDGQESHGDKGRQDQGVTPGSRSVPFFTPES